MRTVCSLGFSLIAVALSGISAVCLYIKEQTSQRNILWFICSFLISGNDLTSRITGVIMTQSTVRTHPKQAAMHKLLVSEVSEIHSLITQGRYCNTRNIVLQITPSCQ